MSEATVRPALPADRAAIRAVEEAAFGQRVEADLVDLLVADQDVVLELVAEIDGRVVGHVLFSRLVVEDRQRARFDAVALAPLAVAPDHQRQGIGEALVRRAHDLLSQGGELLSIVLGDPAYYRRFGYAHGKAAGFDSDYQCDALQALAWGEAPAAGTLVYAKAFSSL